MKTRITIICVMILIIVGLIAYLCSIIQSPESTLPPQYKTYIENSKDKIDIEEITIKDKSNGNDITIVYPSISYKNIRLNKINKIIKSKAMNYIESDEQNTKLCIKYKIILVNDKILSMVFEGYVLIPGAAHEGVFYTPINFDMKKSIEIDLYSIFNINEDFISVYLRNAKDQLGERFISIEKFYNLTHYNGVEFKAYFTEKSLIVIDYVGHSSGSIVETEIKYKEIENLFISNDIFIKD